MHIIIDATVARPCEHKKCALKALALAMLFYIADYMDNHSDNDIPDIIEDDDQRGYYTKIQFIE